MMWILLIKHRYQSVFIICYITENVIEIQYSSISMFQSMHLYPVAWVLGDGLPVAGHSLLDEAENFHVAVSARHDHPGPPEAHGHFHAAAAAGADPRPAPRADCGRAAGQGAGGWRGAAADGARG